MKVLRKFLLIFVFLLCIVTPFFATASYAATFQALTNEPNIRITEWEMIWEENPSGISDHSEFLEKKGAWIPFTYGDLLPTKPANITSAWLRFKLPEFYFSRPALMISSLTAKDVMIFIDNELVYKSDRNYPYNRNEILLSLSSYESNKMVYVFLHTDADWLGLKKQILVGENQTLSKDFLKHDMLDVVLGAALLFVSLAMFLIIIFLRKPYLAGWSSLCVVILSIGLMILSYSPYLHTIYGEYGFYIYYLFDLASSLLMPAIYFFFEKIFGRGPYGLILLFRRLQVIILIITVILLFASFISVEIKTMYTMVTIISFGGSIIIGNLLLVGLLINYCFQGNKEAIVLTTGFGIFSAVGVSEVIWYFIKGMSYDLFFWKWGILSFIAALVVILARRILENYEQVVKYSKQLEVFNNDLQRSEKMEIISQLAASVAHEVRNPLQVTRGFLQLLREKTTNDKEQSFMVLAIDELDRASEIITDFLTFAKPQLEQTTLLNISEELQQIEGILVPLATMQGGVINVELANDLFVRGNSSKFKQALINIIKNSIEALDKEGVILIRAYMDNSNNVVICIKDNGEGMNEADLARLGEPYYSKKSKGTGLGLMVTFRIIEVMQGKLEFFSKKGLGTEAIIHIPSAEK